MKIIYIMGLGRSGSTLLDVILGNHPAMHSIGQFANLVRVGWMNSTACSCGRSSVDCPFWGSVRARWHRHLGSRSEREHEEARQWFERMFHIPFTIPASLLITGRFKFYIDSTVSLYQSVFEACEGRILVDSSKVPLRAYYLSRVDEIDLRLIHIVRDARAAAFSWKKPSMREPRDVTSTAIDWMASNLLSEWVLRRAKETRSLRLRYEDFVDDPVGSLHSIGKLVDENMDSLITMLLENRPMSVTHIPTGNRLRLEGQIRLRPDREWQTSMTGSERGRVWAIAWPLMVRYGYSGTTGPELESRNEPMTRPERKQ